MTYVERRTVVVVDNTHWSIMHTGVGKVQVVCVSSSSGDVSAAQLVVESKVASARRALANRCRDSLFTLERPNMRSANTTTIAAVPSTLTPT